MPAPVASAGHAAARAALDAFLPHAGAHYAARRNYDLGPGQHRHVSQLSPYLRHRVITEAEVLRAVLDRHGTEKAGKYIQEVFWRTYWKGWLEMRPGIWHSYRHDLRRALDDVQTQGGLRAGWEAACTGQTGIEAFDAWARELAGTGYLHNHARMWFASIWIFTLRLPWVLGADFFLRHLLDGDPASNTLSWRWVAGLQTRGKSYLARAANIAEFTEGRFRPSAAELAAEAPPLDGPEPPPRGTPPDNSRFDPDRRTAFVLHEDDLSPEFLFARGLQPLGTALLTSGGRLSPLAMSPSVLAFRQTALRDAATRHAPRLGPLTDGLADAAALTRWASDLGAEQIVTAFAPVGAVRETLDGIGGLPVIRALRGYDGRAWPHATAGFFKFKKQIPALLDAIQTT